MLVKKFDLPLLRSVYPHPYPIANPNLYLHLYL